MPSQTEASKKSAMSTKRGGVAVDSLTSQSNGKHGKKGNKAGVAKVASMQAKTSLPHKDPPRDLAREFTPNDTSNEITQQTSPINPRKRKNAEVSCFIPFISIQANILRASLKTPETVVRERALHSPDLLPHNLKPRMKPGQPHPCVVKPSCPKPACIPGISRRLFKPCRIHVGCIT